MLPEEYRGAYAISSLLEMTEKQQYAQAVNVIREIRELLPGLDGIMKQYLIWLPINRAAAGVQTGGRGIPGSRKADKSQNTRTHRGRGIPDSPCRNGTDSGSAAGRRGNFKASGGNPKEASGQLGNSQENSPLNAKVISDFSDICIKYS